MINQTTKALTLVAKYNVLANLRPAFNEDIAKEYFLQLNEEDRDILHEYFDVFAEIKRCQKAVLLR